MTIVLKKVIFTTLLPLHTRKRTVNRNSYYVIINIMLISMDFVMYNIF